MSADATVCTAGIAAGSSAAVTTGMADTAVTHDVIDAQPPGAQGVPHGLEVPDMSQASAGVALVCVIMWPAAGAIWAAMAWSPCMRHSVPLASNESWSSSTLESTALTR